MPRSDPLPVLGLDADDTLWENEARFHEAEARFRDLMAPWSDKEATDAALLATEGVSHVVTSTMLRAIQTGQPLADLLGITPEAIGDLKESDHQRSTYTPAEQMDADHEIVKEFLTDPMAMFSDGYEAFRERVRSAFDSIVEANRGGRVAVYCHSMVAAVYLQVLLGHDDPFAVMVDYCGIMRVTASKTRTSPIRRGVWVLNTLIGKAMEAPEDVPTIEEAREALNIKRDPTVAELLKQHVSKAVCNACHKEIDPLGLGLENFAQFGDWRIQYPDKAPVVSSGVMPGSSPPNFTASCPLPSAVRMSRASGLSPASASSVRSMIMTFFFPRSALIIAASGKGRMTLT